MLALTAYSASCDSAGKSTSQLVPEETPRVVFKPIDAGISEHGPILLESSESKIDQATELVGSQFVNDTKGWVFNGTSLFVTSDSAKSWKRLPLDLPENARVSSIFFNDENRGWLARNIRSLREPYGSGNSATILVTSDGGASWVEQATFPDGVQLNRLKFVDANEGLAVGARVRQHKPPYDEPFVARTLDGGRTWTDISEKMKATVDNGSGFAVGQGRDMHWLSSSNILLLMSRPARLITTSDGGESWKTLAHFEYQQTGGFNAAVSYQKLLIDPENRIKVMGSATGDEGYRGELVVQNDSTTWNIYGLPGIPIFDAVFLSEKEILAVGMQLGPAKDRGSVPPDGVLLYSSDSGQNWTRLFKLPAKGAFIGLSKVAANQFYAVSEAGAVLKFTIKPGPTAKAQ